MKTPTVRVVPTKTKRSGNQRNAPVRAVIEHSGFALRVHVSTLNRYLNDPSRKEETEAAKRDSAESWLDRGTDGLGKLCKTTST